MLFQFMNDNYRSDVQILVHRVCYAKIKKSGAIAFLRIVILETTASRGCVGLWEL